MNENLHWYIRGYKTGCGRMNLRTYVPHDEVGCVSCLYLMKVYGMQLTPEQQRLIPKPKE